MFHQWCLLVEGDVLADAVCQAFEKREENSDLKDSELSGHCQVPLMSWKRVMKEMRWIYQQLNAKCKDQRTSLET